MNWMYFKEHPSIHFLYLHSSVLMASNQGAIGRRHVDTLGKYPSSRITNIKNTFLLTKKERGNKKKRFYWITSRFSESVSHQSMSCSKHKGIPAVSCPWSCSGGELSTLYVAFCKKGSNSVVYFIQVILNKRCHMQPLSPLTHVKKV